MVVPLVAGALLPSASPLAAREAERPLAFGHGRAVTATRGLLRSPEDSVVYRFHVRFGQRIGIRLIPGRSLVAQAVLIAPSGMEEGPGADLRVTARETGTFGVRVTARQGTSGGFRLVLEVR